MEQFQYQGNKKYSDICINEIYNLNLKFRKIKQRYEKYIDEMNAHVFNFIPENYKPLRVSCNVNMLKIEYKYPKKEIRWFRKTYLEGNKKQQKQNPEEKVIPLNNGEKNQYKGKFYQGTCNKCAKYGHRSSD